jgi:N-acetyl-1-D-myo-inositol-2-amino-2-deoxy-alpha-D-glucopyranoside deacetylase
MANPRTLVFIGAHPDDETFGMGGTFAHYARLGYRTYYVCATRGEAGEADAKFRQQYPSMGDLRWAELMCAAKELGLTEVIYLGYRDSGMVGSKDNQNPLAQINAPVEEITEKIVKILRRIKPEVVVTFDPIGGYRHPDHIFTHQAAVAAFKAAADPSRFPGAGPAFQSNKLYFGVFPHSLLKLAVKVLPILGKDPHKFGKNQDIDLTKMIDPEFPVHAMVRLTRKDIEIRKKATACHASQLGDTSPQRGIFGLVFMLSGLVNGLFGQRDYYMRAYPEPLKKMKREKDLFEGL